MTPHHFTSVLRRFGVMLFLLLTLILQSAIPGSNRCAPEPGDDGNREDSTEVVGTPSTEIVIDDKFLDSFNPDAQFTQPGHSRPIHLQPREDMTITADAGAFEKDVTIRVTDVPAQKMEQLDRLMDEERGGTMLFAYDLDAGLSPDSVIPGKYTVTIDLRKHGIPENMYENFVMYRVASDGHLQPLNIRLNGHLASYQASQNSVTIGGLIFLFSTLGIGSWVAYARLPAVMQTARRMWDAGIWPSNWWKWDDAVFLYVKDDFGNFYVSYRYSMTENGDKTREYVTKKNEIIALQDAMRTEANEVYDRQHPQRFRGWFDSREEEERRRIGRDSVYYRLMSLSPRVQELANDTLLATPKSVEDIVQASRLSNRYCRSVQHMKPLSYEYVVYLTPSFEAFGQEAFRHQTPILDPIVVVNYENVVTGGTYKSSTYPKSLCTIAHETMHVYQMEYVACSLFKNDRYLEATGALVETHFTDWLIKKGKVPLANAFTPEASEYMGYTSRENKEMLSSPLDKKTPNYQGVDLVQNTCGYMLADLLQYLLDNQPNKRDTLDFAKMMQRYGVNKGLLKSLRDIFSIADDQGFVKYYEGFCQKYISSIEFKQYAYRMQQAGDGLVLPNVEHKPDHCVMRLTNFGEKCTSTGYPFMANTFRIIAKNPNASGSNARRPAYNLFTVASEKVSPREMKFSYFMGNNFSTDHMFFSPDFSGNYPSICYAVLMSRPDSKGLKMGADYYYDIVAFYQPTSPPAVTGPSLDKRGLLVRPKVTPVAELKDKGYVKGLQIAMKNNKTGKKLTYVVKTDNWKDVFVATYEKMGITDTADIDISLRSRWYYETPVGIRYYSPATDVAKYRRQRTTVQQTTEPDTTKVIPTPEIEGDDDQGAQQVTPPANRTDYGPGFIDEDAYVSHEYIRVSGPKDYYQYRLSPNSDKPGQRYKAHVKIGDGKFTITVPAIAMKYFDEFDKVTRDFTASGVTVTGRYTMDSTDRYRGKAKVVDGSISFTPGSLHFTYRLDSDKQPDPYHSINELTVSTPADPRRSVASRDDRLLEWEGDHLKSIEVRMPAHVTEHYVSTYRGGHEFSADQETEFFIRVKLIRPDNR